MEISQLILKSLIDDEEYTRRVLPFLRQEYFENIAERTVFTKIRDFYTKYNSPPTVEAIYIDLTNDTKISEPVYKEIDSTISVLRERIKAPELEWLIENTDSFCKDRSLVLALHEAIAIYEGKSKSGYTKNAIPDLLSQALAVGLDTSIGHDYLENSQDRYLYYHTKEEKVPTGFDYVDRITKGGFSKKSFNLFLAGTGGGKTAFKCNIAANNLQNGANVLYVTHEMREEEISRRIDARLMDINMDELPNLSKKMFTDRISAIKSKTNGRLVVKEYPTSSAHVGHIRTLLNELLLKKSFVPDIIYIDYLNIMTSYRFKPGQISNTNTYYKAISEELRGLGVEMNLPIVSSSQFNRGGYSSSDPDLDDTSESFGINFTADFVAALVANEELIQKNLLLVKQLKSRYDDKNRIPMFFMGFDRLKMKFYDVDNTSHGMEGTISGNTSQTTSQQPKGNKGFGGFKV